MPHAFVDIQLYLTACRLQHLIQPDARAQKNTLRALDNKARRKALTEIRVQWRDTRVGEVKTVGIGQCAVLERRLVGEYGIGCLQRVGGIADVVEVGPRR